ncbi:MAG: alpha/beta hydrolase, partial [Bacteroidota bacterium]
ASFRAQDIEIPMWKDKMPNYQECGEKDTLNTDYQYEAYTTVVNPDISVYFPIDSTKKSDIAVLVIPGGAYWGVVHKWEGSNIAKMLNEYGITACVLKYRLPHSKSNITRYKSPLLDAERAMRLIKSNAKKWGVSKVGVMGFSAGGHLASTLGTHFDKEKEYEIDNFSSRPDFMILMYPVITMDSTFTHMGSRNNLLGENPSEDLVNYYSNENQVSKNTPPTLLIHSNDDDVVPVKNSLVFYNALQKKEVRSEMHIYEYGGHGFSLAEGKGYLETWKDICVGWILSNSRYADPSFLTK